MRRKRYQRGSLKPRKRNGKEYWYAQWRADGQPKSKELGLCSRVSKSEALATLDEILRVINRGAGQPPDTARTFQQFVECVYLPTRKDGCWKGSTTMTTEGLIKTHLISALGPRTMSEISRSELQDLLKSKAAAGLSKSVVAHLRWQLSAVFKLAKCDRVVPVNCAEGLQTPRCVGPGEKRVMTGQQVRMCLGILPLRERLIVRLAIYEGMRPGEVLGLQIGDVQSGALWVRRRVYRGEIDDPKVLRSHREVALSAGTRNLLSNWLDSLANRDSEAWLFPSEVGSTPIGRDNLWRRNLEPAFEKAGLGWATFQVMRRTFATLSKEAGVDAKIRADHMGNSVDVNENEYTLTSFDQRRGAVRKLELLIDGQEETLMVSLN
jgi:integrase